MSECRFQKEFLEGLTNEEMRHPVQLHWLTLTFSKQPRLESMFQDWYQHRIGFFVRLNLSVIVALRLIEGASYIPQLSRRPFTAPIVFATAVIALLAIILHYLSHRYATERHALFARVSIFVSLVLALAAGIVYAKVDTATSAESFLFNSIILVFISSSIGRFRFFDLMSLACLQLAFVGVNFGLGLPFTLRVDWLYNVALVFCSYSIAFVSLRSTEIAERESFLALLTIQSESKKSRVLLHRLMPPPVAQRILDGEIFPSNEYDRPIGVAFVGNAVEANRLTSQTLSIFRR